MFDVTGSCTYKSVPALYSDITKVLGAKIPIVLWKQSGLPGSRGEAYEL